MAMATGSAITFSTLPLLEIGLVLVRCDRVAKNRIIMPKKKPGANVAADFIVHKMKLWR